MPDPTTPEARTPAELLDAALSADPAAPLVTFYDDATGERIELSAKTFANWVAKTANLLVDGLGVQPGDEIVLALPPHWQAAAWLFACWSAGLVAAPVAVPLEVAPEGRTEDAAVLVVTEPDLPRALESGAPEIVGLSLHALGGPLRDCPPGVTDYATEVRGYGDRFSPYAPVDPAARALRVRSLTLTGAEVTGETYTFVRNSGLPPAARVLTAMGYSTLDDLLVGLLAPIAAGGSVIIQRNLDKVALDRRISLEHVTAVAGVPGWDAPSGSAYWLP